MQNNIKSDYDMIITTSHFTQFIPKLKDQLDMLLVHNPLIKAVNIVNLDQIKPESSTIDKEQILNEFKNSPWQQSLRQLYLTLIEMSFQIQSFERTITRIGLAHFHDGSS